MLRNNRSDENATRSRGITAREREVLKLVAWGLTHKQISAELGISIKTVEFHKSRAKGALDLHDRADIVYYAVRSGWLRRR